MESFIAQDVIKRLKFDYDFKKENNGWLQGGTCPSCGKKELFTFASSPWVVKCGRANNCATELNTKELYPDIFEGFNKRHKPTEKNPNATADAYLKQARGFDISKIKGWYEQGNFWHPDADQGTATVRFNLDDKKSIYMERFVEQVTITDKESGEKVKRKANFKGSHRGLWWQPPGMVINENDQIWLVEACLDAIALQLNGIKAVAILSCVNYPEKMLEPYKGKNITWVVALDNDKAGRNYTTNSKKTGHVDKLRAANFTATAAQVPGDKKTDWNDLHQRNRLTAKDLAEYFYQGDCLLAKSATEKALLMYHHTERQKFYFEYKSRFFWFSLNLDRFEKAISNMMDGGDNKTDEDKEKIREKALKESGAISEIANCYFNFLYFQENKLTDESWYYAKITFPHQGLAVKNTFTAAQLSSSSEFKKRLLAIAAGSMFTGTSPQLEKILKNQLFNIKSVQTLDYVGYSKEYKCYVYNDMAIKDGIRYDLNDEDFFDAGKLSIKSLNQSVKLVINKDREKYQTDWVKLLCKCFGPKGVTALAFWLGSLFAEQIRDKHQSYPFIEIIGEPGAGKTTLIEFLWQLVGRKGYEGFDPSKSTLAARARNFSQVANLPVVLIEGDRGEDTAKGKTFDWDELKTAYNGRSVRSRGVKNNGNETYEPPFRGSVVISQNAEVKASEAIMQRIVHLRFTRENHTSESKALSDILKTTPMEQVSHFILDALTREREILNLFYDKTPHYEKLLLANKEIGSTRIALNHAQLMALVDALAMVIKLPEQVIKQTHTVIEQLAVERQREINADHPIVQEFWEMFEYLDTVSEESILNHSIKSDTIAVNLNHFAKVADIHRQKVPPISDLKRLLKSSKHRKYIDQKIVASKIRINPDNKPKPTRCWVFENPDHIKESRP
ncbi:MAG: toprim domain-containing protein [Candidatus Pacearchaeota archaeon]|nr:toprim domain-containing protein [Candidatus Pacearchaeota archaeon]